MTCVYIRFQKEIIAEKPRSILFRSLSRKERCIVRYLALYHGYLYLFTGKMYREKIGDAYAKIHNSPSYKNQVITYKFMRTKGIHNITFYDLIIDSDKQDERAYKLKKDFPVECIGKTRVLHNLECINLFMTDHISALQK